MKITLVQENDDRYEFEVDIDTYIYSVTVGKVYHRSLTGGKISADELVKKSFEFLLEREGPESILHKFDLPLINRYFPEYEDAIRTSI